MNPPMLPLLTQAVPTVDPRRAVVVRGNAESTRPLIIARPMKRAKLVAYKCDGTCLRADVDVDGTIRQLHIKHIDHPELTCLGDRDRATLQGALAAIHRDVGDGP